jgi:hypothetical protein
LWTAFEQQDRSSILILVERISILILLLLLLLLESCLQTSTTYTIAVCTVNKLLMMDTGTVRNM